MLEATNRKGHATTPRTSASTAASNEDASSPAPSSGEMCRGGDRVLLAAFTVGIDNSGEEGTTGSSCGRTMGVLYWCALDLEKRRLAKEEGVKFCTRRLKCRGVSIISRACRLLRLVGEENASFKERSVSASTRPRWRSR